MASGSAADSRHFKVDHGGRLYELFLRYNFRLRFIRLSLPFQLSRHEYFVLLTLKEGKDKTARDIGVRLNLEKSVVSRLLQKLEQKKLIHRQPVPEDRRARHLEITNAGIKIVEAENRLIAIQDDLCLEGLSIGERKQLGDNLLRLADGLQAPSLPRFRGADSVNIGINRLTIGMGIIGNDFLGTGASVDRCQLFRVFAQHDEAAGFPMERLFRETPYDFSTLSRLVADLVSEASVVKRSKPVDRRRVEVALTESGKQTAALLLSLGSQRLESAVTSWTAHERDTFIELLSRFLNTPPHLVSRVHGETLAIARFTTEQQRQEARQFLIRTFLAENSLSPIPESMIAASNLNFGLFEAGELRGVMELIVKRQHIRVKLCAVGPEHRSDKTYRLFLREVLAELFRYPNRAKDVDVNPSSDLSRALGLPSGRSVLNAALLRRLRNQ